MAGASGTNSRMEASSIVGALMQHCHKALAAAPDARAAAAVVRWVLAAFINSGQAHRGEDGGAGDAIGQPPAPAASDEAGGPQEEEGGEREGASPEAAAAAQRQQQQRFALPPELQSLLQRAEAAPGAPLLRACFFAHHFEAWASAALAACAAAPPPARAVTRGGAEGGGGGGGGSGDGSGDDLMSTVEATLSEAPADAALRALVSHLSSVRPAPGAPRGGGSAAAAASDEAARLLARRFAEPGSAGVGELARLVAAGAAGHGPAAALRADLEALAALLAAAADRAQHVPDLPPALRPDSYALHAAGQALVAAAGSISNGGGCGAAAAAAAAPAGGGADGAAAAAAEATGVSGRERDGGEDAVAAFAAAVLQRLASRGHAAAVGRALLRACGAGRGGGAGAGAASEAAAARGALRRLAGSNPHALERVLQHVLVQAAAGGGAGADAARALLVPLLSAGGGDSGGRPAAQRDAPPPALRRACAGNLLTRRALPPAALALLLSLLQAADAAGPAAASDSSGAGSASNGGGSLVLEAALAAARAWADPESLNAVPLPQQAATTAALAALLDLLPPSSLAAAAGGGGGGGGGGRGAAAALVPVILGGVSARLGSPLPAVRRQGMRVGRAFAAKMDPSRPPLFEDQQGLDEIVPEEVWWRRGARRGGGGGGGERGGGGEGGERGGGGGGGERGGGGGDRGGRGLAAALARLAAAGAADSDDDDDAFADSDDDGDGGDAVGGASEGDVTGATLGRAPVGAGVPSVVTAADPDATPAGAAAGGAPTGDAPGGDDSAVDEAPLDTAADDGSEVSLDAFDASEDVEGEDWGADGKVASLPALAAALRKQEDVKGVLDALARAEPLLRAAPDELGAYAPEIARALLHCRVPEWADREAEAAAAAAAAAGTGGSGGGSGGARGGDLVAGATPDGRRRRALAALLAAAPLEGGDALTSEVYSPHLDQYQRLLILDSLAAAARELADPRRAPRLEAGGGGGRGAAPRVLAPAAAPPSAAARVAGGTAGALEGGAGAAAADVTPVGAVVAPGMREASTRVRRPVTLAKLANTAAPGGAGAGAPGAGAPRTFRNRFSPVALRWASALLRDCDAPRHGVDLFGRDGLILGRLVATLGAFMECVDQAPAAAPLAAGILELLRAPQVHAHKEVFVRRCALMAAAQVVGHLPPARLAGALVGGRGDAADEQLVGRLQWVQEWAAQEAASDPDEHCRLLAAGCAALQAQLASEALAAAERLPDADALDPSRLLARGAGRGGGGAGSGAPGGLSVRAPELGQRLRLV